MWPPQPARCTQTGMSSSLERGLDGESNGVSLLTYPSGLELIRAPEEQGST